VLARAPTEGQPGSPERLLLASVLVGPAFALDVLTYPLQAFAALFLGVEVGY